MTNQPLIGEAVARCVSILVFYRNSPQGRRAEATLRDDARELVEWAEASGLGPGGLDGEISAPLAAELVARYGDPDGADLGDRLRRALDRG